MRLITLLFCSIIFFSSCRKKDARYEGTYIGIERYTELDSGTTVYSLDSNYNQEVEVTYSKRIYGFFKLVNNPNYSSSFSIGEKSIIDHEYVSFGEIYYDTQSNEIGSACNLRFSGDSLYINSWSSINGDEKLLEFKGKRN